MAVITPATTAATANLESVMSVNRMREGNVMASSAVQRLPLTSSLTEITGATVAAATPTAATIAVVVRTDDVAAAVAVAVAAVAAVAAAATAAAVAFTGTGASIAPSTSVAVEAPITAPASPTTSIVDVPAAPPGMLQAPAAGVTPLAP